MNRTPTGLKGRLISIKYVKHSECAWNGNKNKTKQKIKGREKMLIENAKNENQRSRTTIDHSSYPGIQNQNH